MTYNFTTLYTALYLQETCWKPYLNDRSRTQNDDDDVDDVCKSDDEIEAEVCDCLQQYIQHYVNVSIVGML